MRDDELVFRCSGRPAPAPLAARIDSGPPAALRHRPERRSHYSLGQGRGKAHGRETDDVIGRRDFLKSAAAAGIMVMSGRTAAGAAGSGSADSGTAVPVPMSYEIPHTRTTTPIQGARIYPMSSPFSRTDSRTGLTRNGHLYAAGSGYLWASRDRGRVLGSRTMAALHWRLP